MQPGLNPACARPVVPGHDQQPPGQRRQGTSVQYRWAQQRQRRDALRMSGCEALQIGRTAPGEMRACDLEMVEKLG
jgi:hypothetical protein